MFARPSIVSQETAISGSFQQNLASVCNGVSFWKLIMGWIPGYGSLDGPSFRLSSKLCLCNSFHGCFVPNSKKGQSVHILVFVLLEFHNFQRLKNLNSSKRLILVMLSLMSRGMLPVYNIEPLHTHQIPPPHPLLSFGS